MKRSITLCCLIFMVNSACFSQGNIWDLGAEYQFNSGKGYQEHKLGARYDGFQANNSWNLGITYDFGCRGSRSGETESGYGFSAGYRYSFQNNANGNFFGGVRLNFEFDKRKDAKGKTLVNEALFVPQLETGYQFIFNTHGFATPAIGYGYGIDLNKNTKEEKKETGSRFISGISMGYRF